MPKERDEKLARRIGKRIRAMREEAGWTQEEMAQELGVHLRSISNMECGVVVPQVATVIAIAKAFDVTPDEILEYA